MARDGSDPLVSAAHGATRPRGGRCTRDAQRLTTWLGSLPGGDWSTSPEDIAADAWLTAAAKIGEFAGSDDDFAGWLFTIARNHAANTSRKAVRRRTDPATEIASDAQWGVAPDPSGPVDDRDATRRLLAHLTPARPRSSHASTSSASTSPRRPGRST